MFDFLYLWIIPFIIIAIICSAFGSWLASEKGYSSGTWGLLCFLFGFIALMVICGAPNKETENIEKIKMENLNNNFKNLFGNLDEITITKRENNDKTHTLDINI
ncbi:hypothetical protein FACS1894142_5890 [Spirochaetia bacterium]|nr:hypothetical protein FACS1894142_5890 [Spirochaetia bacterium]